MAGHPWGRARLRLLGVLIPLVGSLGIGLLGSRPNLREATTLTTAGRSFLWSSVLVPAARSRGCSPAFMLAEPLPGLPLTLRVEPLGLLFALVASFLWIVTSVYSIGYMRGHHERNQTRFYVFFAVALSSAHGCGLLREPLHALPVLRDPDPVHLPPGDPPPDGGGKRAGRVYLGILLATSIGLQLLAIIWTYALAGTLDFRPGGILADAHLSAPMAAVLLALFVFGVGRRR